MGAGAGVGAGTTGEDRVEEGPDGDHIPRTPGVNAAPPPHDDGERQEREGDKRERESGREGDRRERERERERGGGREGDRRE